MRVNLLFGFLGSGKTTLVRRLLAERGRDVKTAVIVNEFGEVGVDGEILRGANVDLVELTSGCLCCTLKGSLMQAVEELERKAGIERVIVEATGVAQPGELTETLADATLRTRVDVGPLVTLVDAARFARLESMLGEFYHAQIEDADVVILNKADLASAEELESARGIVRELNPRATVLYAEQADVDSRLLLEGELSGLVGRQVLERGTPAGHERGPGAARPAEARGEPGTGNGHEHGHEGHGHLAGVDSLVLAASGNPSRAELEAFFRGLPQTVWRAKGFLRMDGEPTLVQYSMGGQLELCPGSARAQAHVVFIGRGMDRARLARDFAFAAATSAGA